MPDNSVTDSLFPSQEIEVLPNKDADGNNYLKVLLLSNKLTRNRWIAPFENIGKLPKEVKESFLNIPWIPEHDFQSYKKLKEDLEAQGKSDEEVLKALIEKSNKDKIGYVDHIFDDDPYSTALYGQVKITDPVENEYINTHNRPSRDFSSPGIYGDTVIDADGNLVYNIYSIRAYQQSAVREPAFSPDEAAIKGVCKNGNSESCRKVLAVAGGNNPVIPNSSTELPMENVNNTCGCNKDINMSANTQSQQPNTQPEVITTNTTVDPKNIEANATVTTPNTTTPNLLQNASQSTIEAMEKAKQEAVNSIVKNREPDQKPSEEELQLKEFKKIIEQERAEKQEMRNFFLEELLNAHLPRDGFKNDEAYDSEKNVTKSFINKYNMGLEDAKWIINKVAKGVAVKEDNTSKPKKDVGVAGFYNPDNFLKTNTTSGTVPKPSSTSEFDDSDYPIKF